MAGFALSERFYPPRYKTPKHSHKMALFCFVIEGGYAETYGGRLRECASSTLLFHPPEELHAEHFHDSGGHSFIIEIEPRWLDIALAAGFCDQSHFTRTFKRLTGIAPSQYREAVRAAKG